MQALRHYLLAVQFFTSIPVTGRLAGRAAVHGRLCRIALGPGAQPADPGRGRRVLHHRHGADDRRLSRGWACRRGRWPGRQCRSRAGTRHHEGLAHWRLRGHGAGAGAAGQAQPAGAAGGPQPAGCRGRAGGGACAVAFLAAAHRAQPAACGRHRPVQKQAAGRPDFGRRAAGGIFVVFYAASACLSSAISYLFYSVCTLQRPCRRLDGPLVRAQAAGFYRRLPGCHAAGQRNRLLPGRGAGLALDVTGAPPKTRLWLVRHAQPLVAPRTCYGALDTPADLAATRAAAEHLAAALPPQSRVIHSTLQRCEQLALELQALRPDLASKPDARLREMDFGSWEWQAWESIARSDIDAWTAAFASYRPGLGENLAAVLARVAAALQDHDPGATQDVAWITHAGVIRSVAWLRAHGNGVLPRSEEWPIAAPGWGEWERIELG